MSGAWTWTSDRWAWFLVGLLLLGIIASALLPAGRLGRPKIGRTKCLSQLKQLGCAVALYAEANGGRCPMDASPPTFTGSMQLLSNVLASPSILFCPEDKRRGAHAATDWQHLGPNNISYSYVPNLIWRAPTNAIVLLDRIDDPRVGSFWPVTGNHRDAGGNILDVDGNVRFYSKLPADLRDQDRKLVVLSP